MALTDDAHYRPAHRLVETYDDGGEYTVCLSDSIQTLESVGKRRAGLRISASYRVEPNTFIAAPSSDLV